MTKIIRDVPQGLALAAQSAEFWRRLAPGLSVGGKATDLPEFDLSEETLDSDRMRLTGEGWLHLRDAGLQADFDAIAEGMERLVLAGLPTVFIAVYDEVWSLIAQLQPRMDALMGGKAALVPDLWANYAAAGFNGTNAGRKRPGIALNRDRTPRVASLWLPFTPATPESGCIHVVPADEDACYGRTQNTRADARLQSIRALPAQPGEALIWSGETYAWQSQRPRFSDADPLMSLTLEFQDATQAPIEGYVIEDVTALRFEDRLGLIAEQMQKHGRSWMGRNSWRVVVQSLLNRYRNADMPQSA